MKIGIIQTRGLGDIVIAAPIAMYYIERGCEVYWPIDSEFIAPFTYAFPKINFLPVIKDVTQPASADYFYNKPKEILEEIGCNSIVCLYSHLTGFDFNQKKIQNATSFDAYKYAICKVPLSEKWNLQLRRNIIREADLFNTLQLSPNEKYVVIHDEGSVHTANMDHLVPDNLRTIKISPITDNFLDWLGVLEHAESVYMVNSVYSNLVDQLSFKCSKNLYANTDATWTPIFLSSWNYI